MFTDATPQTGYSHEIDSRGIIVFRFEAVTPATVAAWEQVQLPLLRRLPSRETPGLLMLVDTNGHDAIPFQQIIQHACEYTRLHPVAMPIRHAWVMPVSAVTQAARPMLRLLPSTVDVDVRFFAPVRRQMAYAWLMAERAKLLSRDL